MISAELLIYLCSYGTMHHRNKRVLFPLLSDSDGLHGFDLLEFLVTNARGVFLLRNNTLRPIKYLYEKEKEYSVFLAEELLHP